MSVNRSSSIELLRIVAMLMIVTHHILVQAVGSVEYVNQLTLQICDSFVIYGVNIFLLISGYYLIHATWNKLFSLLFICSFYKVFHLVFRTFFDNTQPTLLEWIAKPIGVIFSTGGWFMDKYLLLFIFAPLINISIHNITPQQFKKYIIILLLLNIVWGWGYKMDFNADGYSLCHFIFVYFLGHGLHLYEHIKKRTWMIGLLLNTTLYITSILISYKVMVPIRWFDYNSPFVLLGAVCIFMLFIKSKLFVNRSINFIAASVFPVYLVHHQSYFCKWFMMHVSELYTKVSHPLQVV